jgi:hypothetical protein
MAARPDATRTFTLRFGRDRHASVVVDGWLYNYDNDATVASTAELEVSAESVVFIAEDAQTAKPLDYETMDRLYRELGSASLDAMRTKVADHAHPEALARIVVKLARITSADPELRARFLIALTAKADKMHHVHASLDALFTLRSALDTAIIAVHPTERGGR